MLLSISLHCINTNAIAKKNIINGNMKGRGFFIASLKRGTVTIFLLKIVINSIKFSM